MYLDRRQERQQETATATILRTLFILIALGPQRLLESGEAASGRRTSAVTSLRCRFAQRHMPLSGAITVLPSLVREYSTAMIFDLVTRLLINPVDSRLRRVRVNMCWETPPRRRRRSPCRWGPSSRKNRTRGVHLPMKIRVSSFDSGTVITFILRRSSASLSGFLVRCLAARCAWLMHKTGWDAETHRSASWSHPWTRRNVRLHHYAGCLHVPGAQRSGPSLRCRPVLQNARSIARLLDHMPRGRPHPQAPMSFPSDAGSTGEVGLNTQPDTEREDRERRTLWAFWKAVESWSPAEAED